MVRADDGAIIYETEASRRMMLTEAPGGGVTTSARWLKPEDRQVYLQALRARGLQVRCRALQCQHMALAGDVDTLGGRLPAGALQQRLAQRIQAGAGACRQHDLIRRHGRCRGAVGLVVHVQDAAAGGAGCVPAAATEVPVTADN